MLPKAQYFMSVPQKLLCCRAVAPAVSRDFGAPESSPGLWNVPTASASMPEAPVDEYGQSILWEIEIRATRKMLGAQDPSAQPLPDESCPQTPLCGKVPACADRGHVSRAFRRDIPKLPCWKMFLKAPFH